MQKVNIITKIMLKLHLIFLIYLGAAFFKDWPWTVQYPEPRCIIVCQVSVTDGRGLHMDTMSEIVVVGVKRVRPRMKGVFGFLCWPVKKAAIEKNMVSCTLSKTPHTSSSFFGLLLYQSFSFPPFSVFPQSSVPLLYHTHSQSVSLSIQCDFTFSALWWHTLPLLSGSSPSPRLQVKSILTHRPQGPKWTVTEFLQPRRGPDHNTENKWLRCQGWTEKSMPVYTDMTVSAPKQFSCLVLETLCYTFFFPSDSLSCVVLLIKYISDYLLKYWGWKDVGSAKGCW